MVRGRYPFQAGRRGAVNHSAVQGEAGAWHEQSQVRSTEFQPSTHPI